MNPYDDLIERMCAAHWNDTANIPWEKIPEDWKPGYRRKMRAAHSAMVALFEEETGALGEKPG